MSDWRTVEFKCPDCGAVLFGSAHVVMFSCAGPLYLQIADDVARHLCRCPELHCLAKLDGSECDRGAKHTGAHSTKMGGQRASWEAA